MSNGGDYRRRYTRPAYVFARLNRGISRSGIIPSPGLTAPWRAITSRLCRIQEFQDAFPRCRGTKRSWRMYLVEGLRALYLSKENFDVIVECYDKSTRCNKSLLFTGTGRGLSYRCTQMYEVKDTPYAGWKWCREWSELESNIQMKNYNVFYHHFLIGIIKLYEIEFQTFSQDTLAFLNK